jgi:hypothetical protein
MPLLRTRIFAAALFIVVALGARAQEPLPPPAAPAPAPAPEPRSAPPVALHPRAPYGFLIHGTVFDDKALSVPGAELRIRRSGEKKYRWTTRTNSRGEFAIRVPPGNDYELFVQVRGFADSTHSVDAKSGLGDESVVVRLELPAEKKK